MKRRSWLVGMLAGALPVRAADPWKKKYCEWKKDDALAILNRSPWAVPGKVEIKIDGQDADGPRSGGVVGPMEGPPGGNGTVGPPGGAPARAGGGIVQNGPGVLPDFKVLVRWESAKPVRLAMGYEGDARPGVYSVSVTGFPVLKADVAGSLGPLKKATRIERFHKDTLWATRAESRKEVLVFTFEGGAQPITDEEREVQFVTRLGAMNLRVKFNLRDMRWERQLAI